MRGMITRKYGYVWNKWSDGETKFKNESMSGRTFKAMAEASENDPAIAERTNHYLHRSPQELYFYDKDPDALTNLIGSGVEGAGTSLCYSQFCLLEQMHRTKDPQYQAYISFLKTQEKKLCPGLSHFEGWLKRQEEKQGADATPPPDSPAGP